LLNERFVILLTGVPGVGKTTIAKILANKIRGMHINLSDFAEKEGLIIGYDEKRDTNIIDLDNLSEILDHIIKNKREHVIIDGHFSHQAVKPEKISNAFVIRKAPWILISVLEERGYSKKKIMENVEAELLDVCLSEAINKLGRKKVCEINATNIIPDEVVSEIFSIIQGRKACLCGYVDWLDHPESIETMREIEDVYRS
jgi:adenylate kinase